VSQVKELRVALTVHDFDGVLGLLRDGLGLELLQEWSNPGGHGVPLQIEKATLELFDEAQAAWVDQVEAGERVSGTVRLAFQVDSLSQTAPLFEQAGAKARPPVITPWGDQNQRLETPEGLQITLFALPNEAEP
jgi:methylmalonyl-CoA/ethylmalonyl-CoA epimerase